LFGDNDRHCFSLLHPHNYLRGVDNDEAIIDEVDRELTEAQLKINIAQVREDDYKIGCNFRDDLVEQMW